MDENKLENEQEKQEKQEEKEPEQNNIPQYPEQGYQYPPKKKRSSLIPVIAITFAILFLFGSVFSFMMRLFTSPLISGGKQKSSVSYSAPYIGVLTVTGTIEGDSSSEFATQSYHHSWTLEKIKELKNDKNNRGLIIRVNTPGGGVYESDELYFAIKDYKESTGRPVYSYMMSQATSGGYYISCPCDMIYANRNCWTGSIGVTIGTLYDISGLLKKYGVKTVTITSGDNKAMGSSTEEMTDEQKEIFQSLVDEAYDQFVGIVAEGRKMDEKKVRKLADGRVYTAKQAKEHGLIDEIASYQDMVKDMRKRFELESVSVNNIDYDEDDSLLSRLLRSLSAAGRSSAENELSGLKALMEENGKFKVTYLAEVER